MSLRLDGRVLLVVACRAGAREGPHGDLGNLCRGREREARLVADREAYRTAAPLREQLVLVRPLHPQEVTAHEGRDEGVEEDEPRKEGVGARLCRKQARPELSVPHDGDHSEGERHHHLDDGEKKPSLTAIRYMMTVAANRPLAEVADIGLAVRGDHDHDALAEVEQVHQDEDALRVPATYCSDPRSRKTSDRTTADTA
eukprot:CAMPEP_0177579892 /NCGR_PEP_ID=MMETSP0419_2-20121207/1226_1 /TAXON_ID=582737 /ORGANISM="Tetraselmis sp., Strain GSL018" /LENGTH=198 /DNA_ID=CAMNT_0019068637 /DNA_START=210 /DNA_END=805 /DNA_ORIENTATION=-